MIPQHKFCSAAMFGGNRKKVKMKGFVLRWKTERSDVLRGLFFSVFQTQMCDALSLKTCKLLVEISIQVHVILPKIKSSCSILSKTNISQQTHSSAPAGFSLTHSQPEEIWIYSNMFQVYFPSDIQDSVRHFDQVLHLSCKLITQGCSRVSELFTLCLRGSLATNGRKMKLASCIYG